MRTITSPWGAAREGARPRVAFLLGLGVFTVLGTGAPTESAARWRPDRWRTPFVKRLCSRPIASLRASPYGGNSIKFMVRFAGGGRAVFKPEQTIRSSRFGAEILAYRLSRALGVYSVPPACERRFPQKLLLDALTEAKHAAVRQRVLREVPVQSDGTVRGALIHWVPRVRDMRLEVRHDWRAWLRPGAPLTKGKQRTARDIADMLLLDMLFNNPDRFTGGNTLMSWPAKRVLMIDNGADFYPSNGLAARYHQRSLATLGRVRRSTYFRLRALTRKRLLGEIRVLGSSPRRYYLSGRELRTLLVRRQQLLAFVVSLREAFGDAAVFLK